MKVVITGGSGFVGSVLVARHLLAGDSVRVLTRNRVGCPILTGVDYFIADLEDASASWERLVDGADVLYHCAGEIGNTTHMHAVHVTGTQRLLQAAAGRVGRWVQLSSVGAYGPVRNGVVTEARPEAPVGEYEETKTRSDHLLCAVADRGDLACVIVRPSNIFGPTMRNRSLFQLIAAIQRGVFCFIGPRGAVMNYIHVDNVVHALMLCARHPAAAGRTYIVSDALTIEEFARAVARALGQYLPARRVPRPLAMLAAAVGRVVPGFPLTPARVRALTGRARYSSDRIAGELGYAHPVSMQSGLEQMVAAFNSK